MVKISERVYAVEIARADDLPTEVYLLNCEGGMILIDTGFTPFCLAQIENELKSIQKKWNDIKLILITHAHGDHIDNLKTILGFTDNAEIMVGDGDVDSLKLQTGATPTMGLDHGDIIDACGGIEVVLVPGHSDGNLSFYLRSEKMMIVGDTIFGDENGKIFAPPEKYSKDFVTAKNELKRLLNYDFDSLLLTHGKNILKDAKQKVADLVNS